jgi:hypothetical protein
MMIRIKTVLMAALSVWLLAGCTKGEVFNSPDTGTILELGFEWNAPYVACLDSDDQETLHCGTLTWLDGDRLVLDLPSPDAEVSLTEGKPQKKVLGSRILRYRYVPVGQSVILFFEEGEMTLFWKDGGFCLEGDIFDRDYLTICLGSAAS